MPTFAAIIRSIPRYVLAGALAGAAIGGVEAIALNLSDPALNDRAILWWAPLFYALLFAPVGAIAGVSCHVLLSVLGRPQVPQRAYAFACGLVITAGTVTALRWRLLLDYGSFAKEYGWMVDVGVVLAALTAGAVTYWLAGRIRLSRQAAIAGLIVVVCAAASFIPVRASRWLEPVQVPASGGPNVILIAIDTLRADFLDLYNAETPTVTPAVNAFAEDSVLFRHAVAQSPWTKPSFGAIYASQHPREHTAIDRIRRLPDESATLAEALRDAGYTTLGMSNSNPNNSGPMNFDQGFGYFEDIRPDGYFFGIPVSGQRLTLYVRIVGKAIERALPYTVNVEQYFLRADRITRKGLDWIETKTEPDRPFFLMLHYMDPHDPYMNGRRSGTGYSHHRFKDRSHDDAFIATIRDAYAGDIEFMDTHIGAFLEGLRERGLYDEALIVLTSDHGEEFFEHGDFYHGRTLYEESIAIPLIVKLPKNRAGGRVNESLARHIDIAPTILALTNANIPGTMRGQPLVSATGESLNENIQHAFSETNLLGPDLASIRTGTAKLIRDGAYGDSVTLRELYDLANDPAETKNLAGNDTIMATTLGALLDAFLEQTGGRPSGEAGELSPGVAEQLKTLGYID